MPRKRLEGKEKKDASEQSLLSFLKRTSEGEYACIDEESLKYSRLLERRETVDTGEEEFYYSVS